MTEEQNQDDSAQDSKEMLASAVGDSERSDVTRNINVVTNQSQDEQKHLQKR